MGQAPRRSPARLREQAGDDAVALAHELRDRIARERRTVQVLREHVQAAADLTADDEPERLQAPQRTAPVLLDQEGWQSLGDCLKYRRYVSPEGALLLELAGEVDMSGALRLRALVSDLLTNRVPELALDLSQVSFMDSNGLSALLWVRRQAMAVDAAFSVRQDVHPQLLRLLHVTKLDAILLAPPG